MQFGAGTILGAGWCPQEQLERVLTNVQPARTKFAARAHAYAAKIAAETILAEPPTAPDLTDDAILTRCSQVGLTPRRSEAHMIRASYVDIYGFPAGEAVAASWADVFSGVEA